MNAIQLAELDLFIAPMLAADLLRDSGAKLKPEAVKELTLLATNDQYLAELEWLRAVDRDMMNCQTKG